MSRYVVKNKMFGPPVEAPLSPEWTERLICGLQNRFDYFDREWEGFYKEFATAAQFKPWLTFPPNAPWGSCAAFVRASLDIEPEALVHIARGIKGAELLVNLLETELDAKHAREQAKTIKQGMRTDLDPSLRGNATKLDRNDRPGILRRVARKRPDLLERFESGELSANAAAIEAGIRPRPIQLKTNDPFRAAATIIKARDLKWARSLAAAILAVKP